jgi:hypothetical protein
VVVFLLNIQDVEDAEQRDAARACPVADGLKLMDDALVIEGAAGPLAAGAPARCPVYVDCG